MDSILTSVKKYLGIEEDYEYFDQDIIMFINSAFDILNQIGVGPEHPFSIQSKTETWEDFMPDVDRLNSVREYVYLSVRLIFDPPTTSFVRDAYDKRKEELQWRLNALEDHGGKL